MVEIRNYKKSDETRVTIKIRRCDLRSILTVFPSEGDESFPSYFTRLAINLGAEYR